MKFLNYLSKIWLLFLLSGHTCLRIQTEQDGREACNILHAAGPSKVCWFSCIGNILILESRLLLPLDMTSHFSDLFFLMSVCVETVLSLFILK